MKRFDTAHRLRSPAGVAALAVALLAGCSADRAEPYSIAGEVRLEAIDATEVRKPLSEEKSFTSLDRSGWERVVFQVPIDQRVAPGAPSPRLSDPHPTPRRVGAYPTPLTAIEPSPDDASESMTAVVAPIGSAVDFPVILLRAIFGDNRTMDEALEHRERAPLPNEIGVEDESR